MAEASPAAPEAKRGPASFRSCRSVPDRQEAAPPGQRRHRPIVRVGNEPVLDNAPFPLIASRVGLAEIRAELERVLARDDAIRRSPTSPPTTAESPRRASGSPSPVGATATGRRTNSGAVRDGGLAERVPGLSSACFSILAPGAHIPRHRGVTKAISPPISAHRSKDARLRMQVADRMRSWGRKARSSSSTTPIITKCGTIPTSQRVICSSTSAARPASSAHGRLDLPRRHPPSRFVRTLATASATGRGDAAVERERGADRGGGNPFKNRDLSLFCVRPPASLGGPAGAFGRPCLKAPSRSPPCRGGVSIRAPLSAGPGPPEARHRRRRTTIRATAARRGGGERDRGLVVVRLDLLETHEMPALDEIEP